MEWGAEINTGERHRNGLEKDFWKVTRELVLSCNQLPIISSLDLACINPAQIRLSFLFLMSNVCTIGGKIF
jgi:hypothetical protein